MTSFLPYQLAWINDRSRLCLAEKSVRIGWTFADALKNVVKRLDHPRRDYLFASKDQPTAFEYVRTCRDFCEIFHYTKSIISHGIDRFRLPIFRDGRDTGCTEEIKVGYIKFDNGSRILAFSSNPNALRAYGGDVGLDEFAFHPNQQALYATAAGRVTWGFDLAIWSSHNGADTHFHQLTRNAAHPLFEWSAGERATAAKNGDAYFVYFVPFSYALPELTSPVALLKNPVELIRTGRLGEQPSNFRVTEHPVVGTPSSKCRPSQAFLPTTCVSY